MDDEMVINGIAFKRIGESYLGADGEFGPLFESLEDEGEGGDAQ